MRRRVRFLHPLSKWNCEFGENLKSKTISTLVIFVANKYISCVTSQKVIIPIVSFHRIAAILKMGLLITFWFWRVLRTSDSSLVSKIEYDGSRI